MGYFDFWIVIIFVLVFIRLRKLNKQLKKKSATLEEEIFLLKSAFTTLEEKLNCFAGQESIEKPISEAVAEEEEKGSPFIIKEKSSEPLPLAPGKELYPAGDPLILNTSSEKKKTGEKKLKKENQLLKQWKKFSKNVDWEVFAGTKLFAWLGVFALFVGAVFFIKLSIENDWIPPALRLAIGAIAGVLLILFSGRFKKSAFVIMRNTLAAAGIGTLYSVVFAATLYYHYLPKPAGFILLSLISVTAFVLAVYQNGLSVSVLGALGAYATPLMVSTGQGSLVTLFIYLAVVNTGLYKVSDKLKSPVLLFTAVTGTLLTIGLAVSDSFSPTSGYVISAVWTANLVLFTFFLCFQGINPKDRRAVLWSGIVLYLSSIAVSLLLIAAKAGWHPLLLITASIAGAIMLAYSNKGWQSLVIPYSVLTFIVAAFWVLTRFDAKGFSISYVLLLVYGAAGSLGPVFLVRQHGQTGMLVKWFKIFPVAISALCLGGLYQNPGCSFLFWPMILGLQIIGIGISLLFRAFIQVILLIMIFAAGGLFWMNHIPADSMGFGFFAFILVSGGILSAMIIFAVGKLPALISLLKIESEDLCKRGKKKTWANAEKWLSAAPAAGVFVLIGAAFFVKHQHYPHPGMVTLVCFLFLSLFFSKRIAFEPPGAIALLSAIAAQSVWILNPDNDFALFFSAIAWSSLLFVFSLVAPFIFFKDHGKWKTLWNSWAVYEVFQSLFVFYSVKMYWNSTWADWTPLIMVLFKLPLVAVLLKQLEGKTHRNSVLAFHGGALLFYISALPVFLLSYGWIGLALVFEATALLWLNKRIEHPGLRKTALVMAPFGLIWLLISLPDLKSFDSLPVLNTAVSALIAAVLALGLAVKLADFPDRRFGKIDLPNYFLWITLGAGFYLLNFVIADIFSHTIAKAVASALGILAYGAAMLIWPKRLDKAFRLAGLVLVFAAIVKALMLPFRFRLDFASMPPLINSPSLSYAVILITLVFFVVRKWKEPWPLSKYEPQILFSVVLAATAFLIMNIEIAACFGISGRAFTLFADSNRIMLFAYSLGWLIFAMGLLVTGIKYSLPLSRWAAIILLVITALKIFILDLASLGQLYRVGSFIGLAFVLILVSYLYQRFLSPDQWSKK